MKIDGILFLLFLSLLSTHASLTPQSPPLQTLNSLKTLSSTPIQLISHNITYTLHFGNYVPKKLFLKRLKDVKVDSFEELKDILNSGIRLKTETFGVRPNRSTKVRLVARIREGAADARWCTSVSEFSSTFCRTVQLGWEERRRRKTFTVSDEERGAANDPRRRIQWTPRERTRCTWVI